MTLFKNCLFFLLCFNCSWVNCYDSYFSNFCQTLIPSQQSCRLGKLTYALFDILTPKRTMPPLPLLQNFKQNNLRTQDGSPQYFHHDIPLPNDGHSQSTFTSSVTKPVPSQPDVSHIIGLQQVTQHPISYMEQSIDTDSIMHPIYSEEHRLLISPVDYTQHEQIQGE